MTNLRWVAFVAMLLVAAGCIVFGIRQLVVEDDALAVLACLTGGLVLRAVGKSLDLAEVSR